MVARQQLFVWVVGSLSDSPWVLVLVTFGHHRKHEWITTVWNCFDWNHHLADSRTVGQSHHGSSCVSSYDRAPSWSSCVRYTVKRSPETFPDWNWIAPCIPAGFGFLFAGWLSNSIWKLIRIYLDFRKFDYYIIFCAYRNGSIRLKIPKIFHFYEEPFPYIYGISWYGHIWTLFQI